MKISMAVVPLLSGLLLFVFLTEGRVTRDVGTFEQVDALFNNKISQLNSDDVSVTTEGQVTTGVVQAGKTLTVSGLVTSIMPEFSQGLQTGGAGGSDSPFNLKVGQFTVDVDANDLTITAKATPTFTIVPGFLSLSEVTGTVKVHFEDGVPLLQRFKLKEIQVAGQWNVGEVCVSFTISVTLSPWEFSFEGAPCSGELRVDKLIHAVGAKMLPAGELQAQLEKAGLNKISIQQASIAGYYSKADGFAVSLSGNPTVEGWGSFRGHVILHRYNAEEGGSPRMVVTVGLDFPSFKLADMLKKIANLDVSDVPVIGSVTIPNIGLVISTGDVDPDLLPGKLDGILANFDPAKKGVGVAAAIPLVPNKAAILFKLFVEPGNVHFSIADPDAVLNLKNIIDVLTPDVNINDILGVIPPGVNEIVNDLLSFRLSRFEYMHNPVRSLIVELSLDGALDLIPNVVQIDNPSLFLNITLASPRKISFKARGVWRIASKDFNIQLEPLSGRSFRLSASADQIDVIGLIKKFGATFLPEELQAPLAKANLGDFRILEPMLSLTVGGSAGLTIQVSGRPSINGWAGLTLNGLFVFKDGTVTLAVGLDFANIGLAGLVQQITGQDMSSLSLLDQSLKIGLVLCSRTLYNIRLQGPTLSKIPVINRGLTIVALFTFPDNCNGDSFCMFAKEKLGPDASLQLSVNIESFTQFVISAGVANIRLGEGIILSQAAIEFGVGTKNYVGVKAALSLANPPITFQGGVYVGTEGIVLEMDMIGIWKRAFAIPYFAFGNAHIRLAIKPQTLMVALEMGAEVRIGKLDTGKELVAAVYVGIDPEQPNNNFFYGSINKATMQALFDAFDLNVPLPKVLAESGFPYGLNASYAVLPQDLYYAGIVIPAGVRINGTMDILGYRVSCLIDVRVPTSILVDIELDPLTIGGGFIKMWRSSTQKSLGPKLYANLKLLPIPSVNVSAHGFISFAGLIEKEIHLTITNKEFIFYLRERFFVFEATLKVYANYGSLQNAAFRVYGLLSTDWMNSIREQVLDVLEKAKNDATKRISDAQKKVDKANGAFDAAVRTLREKQTEVTNANKKFDDAIRSLSRKQQDVNRLCRLRTCYSKCVGCATWRRCCWKVWGRCNGCAGWNGCCWRAKDVICEVHNLGCKGLRALAYAALELAKRIVDKSRWTLDLARAVLKGAEKFVDKSRWPLTLAKNFLEGLKVTVRAGLDAAKWIVNLGLGGVFSIVKMEFDIKIALVESGHFNGNLEVRILGKTSKFGFEFRLKSVKDMVLDLADRIFPGISGRSKREVAERMKRAFPDFSEKHHFPRIYRPGSYAGKSFTAVTAAVETSPLIQVHFREVRQTSTNATSDYEPYVSSITPEMVNSTMAGYMAMMHDYSTEDNSAVNVEEVMDIARKFEENQTMYTGYKVTPSNDSDADDTDVEDDSSLQLPSLTSCSDTASGTREQKCERVKALGAVLGKVESLVTDEYNKYRETFDSYVRERDGYMQGRGEMGTLMTNATMESEELSRMMEENKGNETDMTMMDSAMDEMKKDMQVMKAFDNGVKTWNETSRMMLSYQSSKALKAMEVTLNRAVHDATGQTARVYLNSLMECLQAVYESEQGHAGAEKYVAFLKEMRPAVGRLFDSTLVEAGDIASKLISKSQELKNIKVFCSE